MANNAVDLFFQHLRIILDPERRSTDTDGQLLARWAGARDGRAFASLVARHGALVWRASRGVLHLREDTEDVFQATFLMLARKAAGLQKHSSISGWLYQTASRLALKARTAKLRRLRHEEQAGPKMAVDPLEEISVREARTILAEELDRLSAVHREAILLCLYEGATQDEAAKRLGCSLNTLKRRLERGRALLGQRLTKRGLAPENAFALTLCTDIKIPVHLVHQTITLASKFAVGEATTGTAALLAEGALRTIMVKKMAVGFAIVLGSLTIVAGTFRVPSAEPGVNGNKTVAVNAGHGTRSVPATMAALQDDRPANDEPEVRLDVNGDPLPEGAVQRIGSKRFRHGGIVSQILYAPDGKSIATISSDGYVNLWDAETGNLRWRIKKASSRSPLAFSNDGKKLSILSNFDYTVVAVESGDVLAQHDWPNIPDDNRAYSLAISPDLGTLARGCNDCTVRVYDAATSQEKNRFVVGDNAKREFAETIAFSADGKTIFVQGYKLPGIMVFDATTGQAAPTLEIGAAFAYPCWLQLSQKHLFLAAIEPGRRAVLWNLKTNKKKDLRAHELSPQWGAFSPDDGLFAIACQETNKDIVLFDTATGIEQNRFPSNRLMYSLVFAPDGKKVAAGDGSGCITIWDLATGKSLPPSPEPKSLEYIRFANNGKEIFVFGATVDWWDVKSAKIIRQIKRDPEPHFDSSHSVSPDGKIMAWYAEKGNFVLTNTTTGKKLRTLKKDYLPTKTLFSPDGTKLFSFADIDPKIVIWEVATGNILHEIPVKGWEFNLVVSPNGRWLISTVPTPSSNAAAALERDICLWEVATGKLVHRLIPRQGTAFAMVFSADSTRVVTVAGLPLRDNNPCEVQVWDVASGKEVRGFTISQNVVTCLAVTHDGRMLATGGRDKTFRLWEVAAGKERARILGHEAPVISVEFSSEGNLLAAASNDAPIYLWNPYALEKPKSPRTKLTKEDREKLWQKLADTDAAAAFKAICELIARPNEAVGLLCDAWKEMPRATVKQMRQWLEELNDEQFTVRKSATEDLVRFAANHEDMLREALQKPASLEARQRLERILARIEPERLRRGRMLEIFEQLRTTPARQFLQTLAEQKEDPCLARNAAAELKRLEEHK